MNNGFDVEKELETIRHKHGSLDGLILSVEVMFGEQMTKVVNMSSPKIIENGFGEKLLESVCVSSLVRNIKSVEYSGKVSE